MNETQVGGSLPESTRDQHETEWDKTPIGGTDSRGFTKFEFGALPPGTNTKIVDHKNAVVVIRKEDGTWFEREMALGEMIVDESAITYYRNPETGKVGYGAFSF